MNSYIELTAIGILLGILAYNIYLSVDYYRCLGSKRNIERFGYRTRMERAAEALPLLFVGSFVLLFFKLSK